MDFFDDILVPPTHLFPNTQFSPPTAGDTHPVWIWSLELDEPDEDTGQTVRKYHFDKTMTVRWRVEEEVWQDQAPEGPALEGLEQGAAAAAQGMERVDGQGAAMGVEEREALKEQRAPWRLIGSMSQSGLGCVEWW